MGFIDLIETGRLKSYGGGSNVYHLSKRFLKWGDNDFEPGKMKKDTSLRPCLGFIKAKKINKGNHKKCGSTAIKNVAVSP